MGYTIWTTKTELDNIEMHGKGGGGGGGEDVLWTKILFITLIWP